MSLPHKPYVGLAPYSEADEPFFFGRDKERRTIAFNLMGAKLTLFYGPAGVGKTSVLRAGVSHDLHELALENIENDGRPEFVVVVFSEWRENPVEALIKAINDAAAALMPGDQLTVSEPTLVKTIETWSKHLNSDFLIILDQFEYYFLHYKPDHSAVFADELSNAVNSSALRANFLISIREDALSKLDVFKGKIPKLFDNYLRIEHLRTKTAHDVIRSPIRVYNKRFDADPPYDIEERLISEVVSQIAVGRATTGQTGHETIDMESVSISDDAPIEAPLLQIVMTRLWEEEMRQKSRVLRLITLIRLGNTQTIVNSHLDDEMNSLPDSDKKVAAKIFYHLVTPSGLKIALSVTDLVGYTKEKEEVLLPVLDQLVNGRILREGPSTPGGNGRFEIFHEVLARAVLGWLSRYTVEKETERERNKLARGRDLLLHQQKTAAARSRRARTIAAIAIAVSLIVILLGVFAFIQARKANTQARMAKKAEAQADEVRKQYETEVFSRALQVKELPYFHALLRGHSGSVNKAIFSPDGSRVATVSDDGTARLWNTANGQELRRVELEPPVTDVAFNSDGTLVAIASSNLVTLWDPNNGFYYHLKGHNGEVRRVAFSPTNKQLLASSDNVGVGIVWDVNEKQEAQWLRRHTGRVNDIEWSTQGPLLVTAGADSTAWVWDALTGTPIRQVRHDGPINAAVFTPDGKEILTASDDWFAKLWNSKSGELIKVFKGHQGPVYFAEYARNNKTMVTASEDRTARLWSVKTRELIKELTGYSAEVHGAHFSSDGTRVITWGGDRTSRVWDASGTLLYELKAHIKPVRSAEFSKDGNLAVTSSEDHTAMVWDVGVLKPTIEETKVSVQDYSGPCPGSVRVFGRISVGGASGTVKYRFVLGGRSWPERPLAFEEPGTKLVGAIFRVSNGGSVYLQITSPTSVKSQSVQFHVKCASTPSEEMKDKPQPTATPLSNP
ncbi:MAG: hypothetical protein JWM21_1568 [Acidobacteria bacterium]|nr:hypothetical protein [Acidobacteriota bacterium]